MSAKLSQDHSAWIPFRVSSSLLEQQTHKFNTRRPKVTLKVFVESLICHDLSSSGQWLEQSGQERLHIATRILPSCPLKILPHYRLGLDFSLPTKKSRSIPESWLCSLWVFKTPSLTTSITPWFSPRLNPISWCTLLRDFWARTLRMQEVFNHRVLRWPTRSANS